MGVMEIVNDAHVVESVLFTKLLADGEQVLWLSRPAAMIVDACLLYTSDAADE